VVDFRKRTGEQGTALVEYVLLLGFIATIVMTSVKVLGATTSRQFSAAAAGLASTDSGSVNSAAVDDGSAGTSGSTDTTPPTTPATTVPVTTATTTTTTTVAPAPTTTLPPVATKGSTDLAAPTITAFGSYWWGTSQLNVTNNLGVPLSGVRVTLSIREYTKESNGRWQWETSTETLTTDSDGSVGFYVGPYYGGSSTGSVTQATVAVSSATLPNGLSWDGDPSTITINSP
jgi:Flp pilus assembly pilin Flp